MKKSVFPLMIMGASSLLMQIICLRQLLATFSGNELDIGITLAVWLIGAGAGSFLGCRLRFRNVFAFSFLAIGLLSQSAVLMMLLIRPAFSIGTGETIPLTTTVIATFVSLLPLCLVFGMQFPLAVAHEQGNTPKVYGLEAAGAFFGGALFTFLMAGRIDIFLLSAAIGMINILTGMILARKKALLVLVLIPFFLYALNDRFGAYQWKGLDRVQRVESKYGEIFVLKIRDQMNVYSSGKLHFSYPDIAAEELRAHLPVSVHPDPVSILMVGGSPAVLRELLKYPAAGIDFVEMDPRLIEVSMGLLSHNDRAVLRDPRLRMISEDARGFVKGVREPRYDLVIMNLPEPATASINRFYTTGFFKEVRSVMKKSAIFSLTIPVSSGYISRRMQTANGSIYNSLRQVFPHVEVSSEEYGYIFASDTPVDTDPRNMQARFSARAVKTGFFLPYIFEDAFSPLKAAMVVKRLTGITAQNTDARPIAYLYNLMLWAEMHGGRALNTILEMRKGTLLTAVSALFLLIMAGLWGKRRVIVFSVFTTGYASMAFSVIIILAYQSAYGYIYETIGLLSAVYMVGMAAGAMLMRDAEIPLRRLKQLELLLAGLFLLSPFLLRNEALFSLLNLLCGMFAGMQFLAANLSLKGREAPAVAGRLYAVDLAGSFLGALLASVLLIPLLGVHNMIFSLVSLKAASLLLLMSLPKGAPLA